MRPTRDPAGFRGFTLVEILIVIAIAGVLVSLAIPLYSDYRERARVFQAVSDIEAMSAAITHFALDARVPPDSLAEVGADGKLDPWGRPYEYLNLITLRGHGHARKDKHLNPLNSDFDLYSVGKDGLSVSSLVPPQSRDDVVRANDGRFVGLARDFDP